MSHQVHLPWDWYIYHTNQLNVGEHASPMDGMGCIVILYWYRDLYIALRIPLYVLFGRDYTDPFLS